MLNDKKLDVFNSSPNVPRTEIINNKKMEDGDDQETANEMSKPNEVTEN